MARMFAKHLDRDCHIMRFPSGDVSAKAMAYLDLDETSSKGMDVLTAQAHADVSLALSACDELNTDRDRMLAALLASLPSAD